MNLLCGVEFLAPERAIKEIEKIYGEAVTKKVLEEEAFYCFAKTHISPQHNAIIDWQRKMINFEENPGGYTKEVFSVLKGFGFLPRGF